MRKLMVNEHLSVDGVTHAPGDPQGAASPTTFGRRTTTSAGVIFATYVPDRR